MKPVKRKNFFTFICSFCPGAVEMYMGFMKYGLSLLALFAIAVAIPSVMYGSDIFFVFPIVIYIFSFFHARNLANADEASFATLQDQFFWDEYTGSEKPLFPIEKVRKWFAIVLIIFGVCSIWGIVQDALSQYLWELVSQDAYAYIMNAIRYVPQIVISILAMVGGAKLIAGKKKEVIENGTDN